MNLATRLTNLTALAAISATCPAQTSEYFVMAGDQSMFHVLQGGVLVRSFGLAPGTARYQYALVVTDTVRTMGANVGEIGAQYDLNGVDLGARYVHPPGPSRAWDGTTDGASFYAIDSGGMVFRFDQNWANPTALFDAGGIGSLTYDPTDRTLWVSQFSSTTITHYTLGGAVLGTFSTGHTQNMALALDHADDTLWLHDRTTQGTFEQWSKAGLRLNRVAIAGMASQNALGGEMPYGGATWTPFGSGCAGSNGTPAIAALSPPAIGATFAIDASNLAGGAAFMVLGLGQQSLPLQPLGFGFGPACTLLVTTEVAQFLVQVGGTASWSVAVPNIPGLQGTRVHNQVIELAATSAVSNAGIGVLR